MPSQDRSGSWTAPFIHPWRLESRLEQRFSVDASVRVPLAWLTGRRLLQSADDVHAPLLLLGSLKPGQVVVSHTFDPYRVSLGYVNTHVLAREVSEDVLFETSDESRPRKIISS